MNIESSQKKYEVKASWASACGYGEDPLVVDVIRVWPTINGMTKVDVRLPSGRKWVVIAEWRGRFI